MPYPLPMLPTSACNLAKLPQSHALPLEMSFMKNTIFRALNNLHELAPNVSSRDSKTRTALLIYTANLCDIIVFHVENDAHFFKKPGEGGVVLGDILGPACMPDMQGLKERTKDLKAMVDKWIKTGEYDASRLLAALTLGDELSQKMRQQVMAIDVHRVSTSVPEDVLHRMVQANVHRFASQLDIQFLVPFLCSHHDRTTSQYWPPMSPEGKQAMPDLIKQFRMCWDLAPFDCISGKRNSM
ncbi:hypothetical protein DENSPDRAFT_658967 [Dentipellis sp. KUC8613]|nr:hypothetical protein DENSPDRAFT_658967 [Dentipellis sp. KUC8613]